MLTFKQFLLENRPRTRARAVAVLNRLTKFKGFKPTSYGDIPNLLPMSNVDTLYYKDKKGKSISDLYGHIRRTGKVKYVPIDSVVTNQPTVNKDVLIRKIRKRWKKHDPKIPFMIHHNGVNIAFDGNHRGSEKKLLGQKRMKALVADAEPYHPDNEPGVIKTYDD
jgi:hypothetical protein